MLASNSSGMIPVFLRQQETGGGGDGGLLDPPCSCSSGIIRFLKRLMILNTTM